MDGVIVIRKEKGFTSHDVVAKLRGILHMKKIGHTGTLDPDAEGVLPVALGKATRLVDMITDKEKTYEAVMRLGVVTDTQDMSGTVLSQTTELSVTEEELCTVVSSFVGDYMQVPPMYSALKVNGKKLYELAREGKTVERKPRPVHFYEIEILDISFPLVRFRVTCSKGTYIRTLCHDIGEKLGCGAAMESLLRTKVGRFTLDDAITLAQTEEAVQEGTIESKILGIEEILAEYPRVCCTKEGDRLLANGNPLVQALVDAQEKNGWIRMCRSLPVGREKKQVFPCKNVLGDMMEYLRIENDFPRISHSAVTLGKFDGIHRGHQKLVEKIIEQKQEGAQAVVLALGTASRTILTKEERCRILEEMGVDILLECPLTEKIRHMKAENFIKEILIGDLQVSYVAVGEDFRFGYERKGTPAMLKEFGKKYGFHTEVLPKKMDGRRKISSTFVREELNRGNMEKFRFLMGTDFSVEGIVEHGRGMGHKYLLPTTNLIPPVEKLMPPNGVYITVSHFRDRSYQGITNVGHKPTVGGEKFIGVETYLFDCNEDLYGEYCKVDFKKFLRPEQKFSSLEALKAQLERDAVKGQEYFETL